MRHQFRVPAVVAFGLTTAALLASCAQDVPFVAKDEPWREQSEMACLRSGAVRASPNIVPRNSLGGPRPCGAVQPFLVSAAAGGRVRLAPAATLQCPMIPAIDRWLADTVQPAARRAFGQPVVQLKVAASYSCRARNGQRGGKLSEHGLANAIDISAFILADGRKVLVKTGWGGRPDERTFLREAHQGGCNVFSTVLGPSADRFHHDHFHFDLARHGRSGTYRVCK